MKILLSTAVIGALAFAGCASTPATSAATTPTQTAGAVETMPAFAPLELSGAKAMFHLARDNDHKAETDLKICVAPSGDVVSTKIVKSSGNAKFDGAVAQEVETKLGQPFASKQQTPVCRHLRVKLSRS